jgi:hypothetical protein
MVIKTLDAWAEDHLLVNLASPPRPLLKRYCLGSTLLFLSERERSLSLELENTKSVLEQPDCFGQWLKVKLCLLGINLSDPYT